MIFVKLIMRACRNPFPESRGDQYERPRRSPMGSVVVRTVGTEVRAK